MTIYIEKDIPYTCMGCLLCTEDGECLATDSIYRYRYTKRPSWCPIKKD